MHPRWFRSVSLLAPLPVAILTNAHSTGHIRVPRHTFRRSELVLEKPESDRSSSTLLRKSLPDTGILRLQCLLFFLRFPKSKRRCVSVSSRYLADSFLTLVTQDAETVEIPGRVLHYPICPLGSFPRPPNIRHQPTKTTIYHYFCPFTICVCL